MHSILSRLRSAFPFAGDRPATEDDFFKFCSARGVRVVFSPKINWGIYAICRGEHFIFLNSRLSGWMLLYVMFHELGHYLCGCSHTEAEATAAYLLLPIGNLLELTSLEMPMLQKHDRLASLIETRLELHRTYGT